MKEIAPLNEAGKRIERLDRELREAIMVRNMLVILGKVTVDEFAELETIVRNMASECPRGP